MGRLLDAKESAEMRLFWAHLRFKVWTLPPDPSSGLHLWAQFLSAGLVDSNFECSNAKTKHP